jgi:hypothetical protein
MQLHNTRLELPVALVKTLHEVQRESERAYYLLYIHPEYLCVARKYKQEHSVPSTLQELMQMFVVVCDPVGTYPRRPSR